MATTDAALSLQDATAGLFGQQQHHSGGRADSDGPTVNVTLPTSLRIFQVSSLDLRRLALQALFNEPVSPGRWQADSDGPTVTVTTLGCESSAWAVRFSPPALEFLQSPGVCLSESSFKFSHSIRPQLPYGHVPLQWPPDSHLT